MLLKELDYELPEELIAQTPLEQRDLSRLLVLDRRQQTITHRRFRDLPEYLHAGDVLVANDTRVLPARLYGVKWPTGARIEFLLLREIEPGVWETLVRPSRRLKPGTRVVFGEGQLVAEALERTSAGWRMRFDPAEAVRQWLPHLGETPLPPYIKRRLQDPDRYQTVYAAQNGSAAAPTAGLHFTPELLQQLQAQGVVCVFLTLHIGLDTFRPIKAECVEEHSMHSEYYEIPAETAAAINAARTQGKRVVAVGTTCVRALESAAQREGPVEPRREWTSLFITPGYRFRVVDALVTNFHLPRSTLLALIYAFAGTELVRRAYAEAVQRRYRFLSFGDAMLIL
ncbi:MAG TPA: tRNA preQ1(34) S-adenosylmethionine ribosyltransferase-isomerase QueA [Armatimonadetes bacterium]|nr:tRNA preQ1(34) S-adenosylmethionine ribosyltransferase-isomerase QueA [Armatimonadota bacterium]